jgi:hypothetical protein
MRGQLGMPSASRGCVRLALPLVCVLTLIGSQAHADRSAQVALAKQMLGKAPPPEPPDRRPRSRPLAVSALLPPRPAVPWWFRSAPDPGEDPGEPPASIYAESIHDVAAAGLLLSGTGEGNGGPASGRASTLPVRTVGGGKGVTDLDAFDHRHQGVAHVHVTGAPSGSDGRIPPRVIEAIVRDNFGRFQVCYDSRLRAHAELAGRVAVKFVIDGRGSVALASDAGSDLPDADVVSCIVRAFDTLTFPESTGGPVTVVYPLVFSPGSANRP